MSSARRRCCRLAGNEPPDPVDGRRPHIHSVPDLRPESLELFADNLSIAEELLLTGDPYTPSLKVAPE